MASFARLLLVSLALSWLGSPASASGWTAQRVTVCPAASASAGCSVVPLWVVNSTGKRLWVNAAVPVDRSSREPLGVFIKAFAASAVYWDGQLIGRNGRPSSDAATEMPGLRDAVIDIPAELSRPGVHRLEVEMSTMRAPVRVAAPLLELKVARFEPPLQPALRYYLPALLTAGGMIIAMLGLALVALREARLRGVVTLLSAELCAAVQLAAEASRAFALFAYPAQIVRLEIVLAAACGFGLLLVLYLAERFAPGMRRPVAAVQLLAVLVAIFAPAGFDQKVVVAILSSVALGATIVLAGVLRKQRGAGLLLTTLLACFAIWLLGPSTFLDRGFYPWALLLFVVTFALEALCTNSDAEQAVSSVTLEALWLGSGRTRHLVAPADIVRLSAADDYTEIFIAGAPPVLHPEPLHAVLGRLPSSFVRVHRSHVVNLAHLKSFRRGSRSSVLLSDESVAPVSRRCAAALVAAISA